MRKTRATVVALALLLGIVVAAGYRIHAANRARTIAQFESIEQHTSSTLASLLQLQLTAAAHLLETLADVDPGSIESSIAATLVASDPHCAGRSAPCFTAVTAYDADGTLARAWGGRAIDLPAADRAAALVWARDPAHLRRALPLILSPQPPSLVLVTPRRPPAGGALAAQIDLDSLFLSHQGTPDVSWDRFRVLVMRTDGTVLFHSTHPEMRLNNIYHRTARCATCHESFAPVERMLTIQNGTLEYEQRGAPQIAALAPLAFEGDQWIVSVEVNRDAVTEPLTAQAWQLLGIAAVALVLLGAAGAIVWRDDRRRSDAEALAREKAHLEESHAQLTTLNSRLELAAQEWRTTADTIDAALIVLEPEGVIQRMNIAAAATLPGTLTSWLGRPSDDLAAHEPWPRALSLARRALQRDAPATARIGDGGKTWELWCRPLRRVHARPAVIVLARDVTDFTELQESVRRAETMATLGTLVVGVAHEVRNPLFAISSLVDAWAVQQHRDPRPFVDALRGEVDRLRTLMTELLEYGKPATAQLAPRALLPLVDAAVQSCAHEAVARHVGIERRGTAAVEVAMDPRRLERVFINIIQNAIQHAPTDSVVRVDVRAAGTDGSSVEIRVRDQGTGFAPNDLPKIFTPFFSRRPGGFGLGLAITERIVSEHNGTITAANHPDGGALVMVTLPAADRDRHACDALAGEAMC